MARKRCPQPPILDWLEREFARTRKKVTPRYPFEAKSGMIHLPDEIRKELRLLVFTAEQSSGDPKLRPSSGSPT
jgi:hypothetical protein